MRVLYLYGEELTGRRAREIHALNRLLSLARLGIDVTLLTAYGSEASNAENSLLKMGGKLPSSLHLKSFSREWKMGGISVKSSDHYYRQVGAWIEKEPSFDCIYGIHLKAASSMKRRFPKIPFIFESHEVFSESYDARSWRYRKLCLVEQSVYQNVDAVVSTSLYLLSQLEKSFKLPAHRLVSPNCAESLFFDWECNRSDRHRLLYLGSFQPWKGVVNALKAMDELPEFELTVIGGTEAEIHELKKGAPSNVRFLGFRSHNQIREEVEKASIALIPNRLTPANSLQTFPMKLVEYAAAGKKIVATDLPILTELKPGDWCSRVPADQPHAIAEAVRFQSSRAQETAEIRDWARSFQWGPQAERIQSFLEELLIRKSDEH